MTYKYVGVNQCYPMSVNLSRLTAVKARIIFLSLALLLHHINVVTGVDAS